MPARVDLTDNTGVVEASLKAAARAAQQAGARGLQAGIRSRTPRRTGRLASSYHIEEVGGRTLVTNRSDTDYGPFVEFGTRYDAAQPHVRPALEAEAEPFKATVSQTIKRSLG